MKRPIPFLLLAALPLAASAQTPPDALHASLDQSLDRIQLGTSGSAWSLNATVQYLDHGKPADAGTLQLLYAGRNQYRIAYDFPGFHQIFTHTSVGRRSEGDAGEPPPGLTALIHFLEHPADRSGLNTSTLKAFHPKSKGVRLDCVHAIPTSPQSAATRIQTFCTVEGSPSLRYASLDESGFSVFFQKLSDFQNREVPLSAYILFNQLPIARLQFTFASLSADQQASIAPSLAAHALTTTTVTFAPYPAGRGSTIANNIVEYGYDPAISPNGVASTDFMLLRVEIEPSGKVAGTRVIATSNARSANKLAANLRGKTMADPSNHAFFINEPITTTIRGEEDHGIAELFGDRLGPSPFSSN